jgi:hypothetical protein
MLGRIEGLSFGLNGLYPELAESIEEQTVRCEDALIEWRVRGARRERAFERVERGQERKQCVTPALVTRLVVLPRHPASNVLEVGEQSNIPVLLFTEAAAELFHVVGRQTVAAAALALHGSALP